MKFKSPIFSSASGHVAGLVFSHNKGGNYVRQRSLPTNPNSPQQQEVRAAMGQLASLWNDTLTPTQRATWDVWAANTPFTNSLGDTIFINGMAAYARANIPRIQVGLPRVDAASPPFNFGDFTTPSFSLVAATGVLSVTFDNSDVWANEDDSAMLVYTSRQQNVGINFFKGPYRFADAIAGDAVTPPTSPATVDAAFPATAGQKVFVRVIVSRADGRLSQPFRGFCLAT